MANLTQTIKTAIEGAAYVSAQPTSSQGLMDYHRAQAVKAALRRRDPRDKLSGVREALNCYRVSAWLTDEMKIRLVRDGKDIAIL